jgi:CRISPR-associated protein Cmr2
MNWERYREKRTEAQKQLSGGLSYGFASAVIWQMVDGEAADIDVSKICEISQGIVRGAADAMQERDELLTELHEFENSTEARVALLSADTDKVKSYVFESPRLPEMRGGSLILEELNDKKSIKAKILGKYELPEDCIIYSSGGSILMFVPDCLRDEIKEDIEKRYLEKTITATITVVTETFSYAQFCFGLDSSAAKPFGELVDLMAYKIRRAKQERKYAPFCETIPFARLCDSCGIRPVSQMVPEPGERPARLCQSCCKKRVTGRDNRGYLLKSIQEKLPSIREKFDGCENPSDLGTIANVSGDGYIGLIYADGNGIGKKMENLSSCDEYRQFARDMSEATSVEICRTLAIPNFITEDDDGVRRHGIEMLCGLGSDDVMAVVPGKYALDLAVKMCRAFQDRMSSHDATMSAGVIIAPYSYPVYYLEEICEQLLKSAKNKSRDQVDEATIDFWAITSQEVITSDLETYRKQAMEMRLNVKGDRLVLYERPYTLERLQRLLYWARKFDEEKFPQNQLYGLREVLEEGRMQANLYYLYQLSRMSRENRKLMRCFANDWYAGDTAFFPWKETAKPAGYKAYSTPIADLLEIYELAAEAQNGSGNPDTDQT